MVEIKKNYSAFYKVGSLLVKVKVKLERRNFGRSDMLVSPVTGSGEQWISAESLEDEEGTPLNEIKKIDHDDEDDDS